MQSQRISRMIHRLPLLACLVFSACVPWTTKPTLGRYVPPEQAAWFKFKDPLPEQGKQTIPGSMAVAMRIAAGHFLPWDVNPPADATATGICLLQRQAWDVEVAPWAGNVMLVGFNVSPGGCRWGGSPLMDLGATYAVSLQEGRVLAISYPAHSPEGSVPFQFPEQLPRESLQHIEGNTAAAIQLATDEFLAGVVGSASSEPACVSQLTSYDVTAVPTVEGVTLVRFDVNDERCPPLGPPDIVEGKKYFGPSFITTYAIDIRMMRILGIDLTTRQQFME
jgi:hypothetical protein